MKVVVGRAVSLAVAVAVSVGVCVAVGVSVSVGVFVGRGRGVFVGASSSSSPPPGQSGRPGRPQVGGSVGQGIGWPKGSKQPWAWATSCQGIPHDCEGPEPGGDNHPPPFNRGIHFIIPSPSRARRAVSPWHLADNSGIPSRLPLRSRDPRRRARPPGFLSPSMGTSTR